MKTINKTICLILMMVMGMSLQAQNNNRDLVEVQVDGLGCPFCAYGLEKKFKEFKGIDDIAIDIETGDFSFTYPTEKTISMKAVLDQVIRAGYTPNEAKITRANGAVVTTKSVEESKTIDMEEVSFYVNGTCGMCKSRIEKTLLGLDGLAVAEWDKEKKEVTVFHDPKRLSVEQMQQSLLAVGHDTDDDMATDKAYKNLPPCCKYKREVK
ncbi:heavy metal transporter [Nonlabens spongiae]|uniref:Heavy metal transporter n=1 Tax=Nonlabens spongiae TaxID=331648 RepID=A0A1W6MM93_9FLAO|nr:heavy-metal-associated domain-containing protein [Nonlabens spongiae]ARN78711.1 heavy metal transporter [Nonlabens spongiae]